MQMAAEDAEFRFEDGLSWLPAHILREACGECQEQVGRRVRRYQQHHHHLNGSESHQLPQFKSVRKYQSHNKGRYGGNRASSGGPGMQAVFLDRGHKSCGTGVFLPRGAGTDFQLPKKPACAPVLLPSRVVQALNLNVQELGLNISPRQDHKSKHKGKADQNMAYKKEDDVENIRDQRYTISQDRNCSPELYLPKEWSY